MLLIRKKNGWLAVNCGGGGGKHNITNFMAEK
jgi:hypothetical protein